MKNNNQQTLRFFSLVLFFFCCFAFNTESADAASERILSKGQTVYVPVYSHIYSGDREHPFYLAATLSVRNTDPKHAITILSVDYKESDKSGGSGANFTVKWKSDVKINAPIIESIMIGTKTQQGISFISPGRVIQE